MDAAKRFKKSEAELMNVLIDVESQRVFLKRGHASLFSYVVNELGLGENTAYCLITVARKARQFPALRARIQSGAMTLSNARRVASVLTLQNQEEWISKACELSSRQLEKEIVKEKPSHATVERASYVSSDRIRLEIGLSEREMLRLRRVQDLMSQSRRKSVSLEEVIQELSGLYLRKNDPVEIAKRHHVRKAASSNQKTYGTSSIQAGTPNACTRQSDLEPTELKQTDTFKVLVTKRVPIASSIKHQVNLRDQRRCTHLLPNGARCNQSRFVEIHHKVPVNQGGSNELQNLTTLCSAHHQLIHLT
jgi:5-methylcytosine-specific restriction endonuclease McrA